ncbi:TPA: YtnP family quorum-quenching lactonase [Listeria innocua]|uniref:Lin1655 protein n=1 Tax=Listeria innocua serovar 6a (strain ATCC BAA-680 / CLIP 11262) TaxID=272626 RepID=Q92B95_LISIN|nr:MBL fold metallo-hydrolase [Listeria innocua]EAD5686661.1 MBL fold metallo-hydrolase [Listeria innocua]EAD5711317.1 MBL fold metallo-hydrolase [Listeria innocua]EAG8523015.1 MBL fold metallo-hydrolase [Listeria innocua]EAH4437592.1 MBL fold metallo-hydrolase [Listeria innocua]EAH4440826.1 MBL fold metallo-hydrolase [Listeria innocua]
MDSIQIGEIKIYWLRGGYTHFDGGAMFGVVPKPLWEKKYPANEKNQLANVTDPMFFQYLGKNYLIDSGLGNGRLTEKQKRNYGVTEESFVLEDLAKLNIAPEDIDYCLMTHLHFDHVLGLTGCSEEGYYSIFPNAEIWTSEIEWDEMQHPNIRSKATYWQENWQAIKGQVHTFTKEKRFNDAIKMTHTGGHSAGHSAVWFESGGEVAIHMADIFPTFAHQNVLWVTAYDDYPMTSIAAKQDIFKRTFGKNYWFLSYHDARFRAVKIGGNGEIDAELKIENRN